MVYNYSRPMLSCFVFVLSHSRLVLSSRILRVWSLPRPGRGDLCVESIFSSSPQFDTRIFAFFIPNCFGAHPHSPFMIRPSANLSGRRPLTPLKSISTPAQIAPKSFGMRSSMISAANPFRIRSSKNNRGEGVLWLTKHPMRMLILPDRDFFLNDN